MLICLTNPIHIRNFISSGAFKNVLQFNQVQLLLPRELESYSDELVGFQSIQYFERDPKSSAAFDAAFQIVGWRYRKKSPSFKYRERRHFPPIYLRLIKKIRQNISWGVELPVQNELHNYESTNLHIREQSLKSYITPRLKVLWERVRIKFMGNPLVFSFYTIKKIRQIKGNVDLSRHLNGIKPNLIIHVTSGHEATSIEIAKFSGDTLIPSLFLVDNWDNLSSKTILWEKPTYIATWGQQSTNHAVEIQEFAKHQVFNLGSPRFQNYFDLRNSKLLDQFNFPYVLFVGTAIPMNELYVLSILDKEISNNQEIYGDLKIIYRPHPWRHGKDKIDEKSYARIVIDPQVRGNYLGLEPDSLTETFLPNLDYYPSILANSKFVIGGLTSMLLEASILRKSFVAIAYPEPFNILSPKKIFKGYTHFKEINSLPNLEMIKRKSSIVKVFRSTFIKSPPLVTEKLDSALEFFIYSDEYSYSERLSILVSNILGKSSE